VTRPIIQFIDVTIQFGEEVFLKNISFEINSGEKFILIGPSGHGKSLILKAIAGLISPTSGQVLVHGMDWSTLRVSERDELMRSMGMLFQKNALFDSLTNADNIAFPLREVTNLSEDEIQKKVKYFLEEVGIPHAYSLFPDEISGGMQKRLGIARALALDPNIILYDDPTAGLDPITSRKIVKLIIDVQEKLNSTVVAVTNDMNRAFQLADRIAMVVDKEIIVTGSGDSTKLCTEPRVRQFIRGRIKGPLTVQR
jgi:phospholipid/cholesterol/gamma-HCH transport system ATP-binding protein